MERRNPEVASLEILPNNRAFGYLRPVKSGRVAAGILTLYAALLTTPARAVGAQMGSSNIAAAEATQGHGHWWSLFVGGFASSILAHESAHIVASYAVGGRPSFGLNAGRPTIYSG